MRIALSLLLGLLAGSPLLADDIEVYVGRAAGSVKPNVLFVLDNSGSMYSQHESPLDYDPGQTYAGGFDPGFVYWSIDGSVPGDSASLARFPIAANQCDASRTALASYGIYTDRIAGWRVDAGGDAARNAWELLSPLLAGAATDQQLECATDFGVHGAGDLATYPVDGALGPWSTLAEGAVDWAERGASYTLFDANFLNYHANPPVGRRSRHHITRQVVEELARRLSGVNVGLLWFSKLNVAAGYGDDAEYQGGYVAMAMSDIDVPANRQAFIDALVSNDVERNTDTPLSETFYEAYQYYAGGPVTYGLVDGVSVAESRDPQNPANYLSPIQFECQQNFTVLMTDGRPSTDQEVEELAPLLPNFAAATGSATCDDDHIGVDGICLDELAQLMADENTDLRPGDAVPGAQQARVYTIGFHSQQDLLEDTAEKGGGRYFTADNTAALSAAFSAILDEISQTGASFTAPSVSVNGFSRTSNRDSLYLSTFKPSLAPHWEGNLKKYRLAYDATSGEFYITDQSGTQNVIEAQTGEFLDTANSFWSTSVDGNDPLRGGARDQLIDALLGSRRVWTDIDSSVPLSNVANRLHEGNTALTTSLLGVPAGDPIAAADYRSRLLRWARGVDVRDEDLDGDSGDSRRSLGDPLHSQPVLVQYGGSETEPDIVAFFTTNDGYLHAVDAGTGKELFAFVPSDLLPRLALLYENIGTAHRPYGLDGSITLELDDGGDGVIDPANGDRVRLYFGMRRGGYNVYALDVTRLRQSQSSASLLWTIRGGAGNPNGGSPGFGELGQTWSQPLLRKIRLDGADRRVLVFAGGYDRNQDNSAGADGMGRALYIVDADTGERLWAAGNFDGADLQLPQMTHSIPSRVAAFDTQGDGLMDRIYVGDSGGQVWRFDLSADNQGVAGLASGGRIASLAGSEPANQRRFYDAPDVALINDGGSVYLSLVMGSGYRAHPLDENIVDRIYMLRDEHVFDVPTNYQMRTETDLYDATENIIGQGSGTSREEAIQQLSGKQGWYIRLTGPGEKVVSPALIVNGVAILSTFVPEASDDPCQPGTGVGAAYYLNVSNATPTFDFFQPVDGSTLTREDRKLTLQTPGIPPDTAFIVTEQDGELVNVVLHGKELGEDPTSDAAVRTYWYEQ